MRRLSVLALALLATACAGLVAVTPAGACSLDNRPSAYADGQLARANPHIPTSSAQLASWSPFVFARNYQTRHTVTLTESRSEVARSLRAAAMRRPWRWSFGDGHTAYGWTVRHTYTRAGHWRIAVDAYDPGTRQWYNFDQIIITIRR
jgi:hypothetical protein